MTRWWRCYDASPYDPRWRVIATRMKCKPADVWAVITCILGHAAAHGGSIRDLDPEVIAVGLGHETFHVTDVTLHLVSLRFIENNVVSEWGDWQQGELSTKRVRAFRNKNKQNKFKLVTPQNAGETIHETDMKRNETDETFHGVSSVSSELSTDEAENPRVGATRQDLLPLSLNHEQDLNLPPLAPFQAENPLSGITHGPAANRGPAAAKKARVKPTRSVTPRWFGEDEPIDPVFYELATEEYPEIDAETEWVKFRDWHLVNCKSTGNAKASFRTWLVKSRTIAREVAARQGAGPRPRPRLASVR